MPRRDLPASPQGIRIDRFLRQRKIAGANRAFDAAQKLEALQRVAQLPVPRRVADVLRDPVFIELEPGASRAVGDEVERVVGETAFRIATADVRMRAGEPALEQHLATDHLKKALDQIQDLCEGPPEIRRYTLV